MTRGTPRIYYVGHQLQDLPKRRTSKFLKKIFIAFGVNHIAGSNHMAEMPAKISNPTK